MNCNKESSIMPDAWIVIIGLAILLILYFIISSRLKARRLKKIQEKIMPKIEGSIRAGEFYDIHLNNGRIFKNIKLLGKTDASEGDFIFNTWEDWIVIEQSNKKRVFIRPNSIKLLEEV